MPHRRRRGWATGEGAQALSASETPVVDHAVGGVVGVIARSLPEGAAIGVTLRGEDGAEGTPIAASAPLVARVGEIVGELRTGPERAAAAGAVAVSVPDLAAEFRWDGYAERVLALGVRSVLSYPVDSPRGPRATLDLYAPQPDAFDDGVRRVAEVSARHIGRLLGAATDVANRTRLNEKLRRALAARGVVDQAAGILMGQRRWTQEQAFEFLHEAARQRDVELAALAADIVTRATGTAPPLPHFDESGR
ncbi:GAF and ANTAR domain-containing protein [Nocardia blacklockiae]|uniref:GAF and ANTAR domain-containing protein n=1 Tax=Nocardia blacklockiae TaxID=480036 RepID=UPI001894BB8D|nr:ANTAR domain-containing protein [Nocardia blacklockiae]MBF6169898.1 ANTAR domain-containing protein [Nocardia blacklockiae]